MSTHESEDELPLPGWVRKRRVLRLSSDISQPDPIQTASTGENSFTLSPTSDNSSDENCWRDGQKKSNRRDVLRSGRTTRLSFKKRQEVAARSHSSERPKRKRKRRERQSSETETDTSQEADLRRTGVIPESVLLSIPEVDMCSIEDEIAAVKKSKSTGSQNPAGEKCSADSRDSLAQSHKPGAHCNPCPVGSAHQIYIAGNSPACDSKMSPDANSSVNINPKEKSPTAERKEGEGTTGESGHLTVLDSWQYDLCSTSAKAPVLFALEHMQDVLNEENVQWMSKARRIWTTWKKQPQDVRKEYVERAKENRKSRSEQTHPTKRRRIPPGSSISSKNVCNPSNSSQDTLAARGSTQLKQVHSRPSSEGIRKEPLMVVGETTILCAEEVSLRNDPSWTVGPSFTTMAHSKLMQPVVNDPPQLARNTPNHRVTNQSSALPASGPSVTWPNLLQTSQHTIHSASGSSKPPANGSFVTQTSRPSVLPLTNGHITSWTSTTKGSSLTPLLSSGPLTSAFSGPSYTSSKLIEPGIGHAYSTMQSNVPLTSKMNGSVAISRPTAVMASSPLVVANRSTGPGAVVSSRPTASVYSGPFVVSGPISSVGPSGSLVGINAQSASATPNGVSSNANRNTHLLPNVSDFSGSQPGNLPSYQAHTPLWLSQGLPPPAVCANPNPSGILGATRNSTQSPEGTLRTTKPFLSYSGSSLSASSADQRPFSSYSIAALGLSQPVATPTLPQSQGAVPILDRASLPPTGHSSGGHNPAYNGEAISDMGKSSSSDSSSLHTIWSPLPLSCSMVTQMSPAVFQTSQPHQPTDSQPVSFHVTSPTMVSFLHPSVDQAAAKQLDLLPKPRRRQLSKSKPRPPRVSDSHNSLPASPSSSVAPAPSGSRGDHLAQVSAEWKEALRRKVKEISSMANKSFSSEPAIPVAPMNKPKRPPRKRAGSGTGNQLAYKKSLASPMQASSPTFLGSLGFSKPLVAESPSELSSPQLFPSISCTDSKHLMTPQTPLSSMSVEHNPQESSDQSTDNTGPPSPLSPTSHMLSASDACNYAALERHYWQAELMLERQKQYVSSLKRRRQHAQVVQQLMLLQSDRYNTFRNMVVQPPWEPEVPINLPGLREDLPALEIEGTFDHPVMKGEDIYKKLMQTCLQ